MQEITVIAKFGISRQQQQQQKRVRNQSGSKIVINWIKTWQYIKIISLYI